MGQWGTGKLLKTCKKCEKEFFARRDRLGIYCSKSCSSNDKIQINYKMIKFCNVCNKEYKVKRYRKESSLYCSVECRRKKMPSGENHPSWKGGIARTWKSKIIIKRLIKEKGKCEICEGNNYLQGHHIMPYSLYKESQDDPKNIMILCRECHAKQHPDLSNFILKGNYHE